MNALVDRACIEALYAASHGGRAGRAERARHLLPASRASPACRRTSASSRSSGASSSTRASTRSSAATRPRCCIGSADLMPRNLDNRVELVAPVEDPALPRRAARHARALPGRQHALVGPAARRHVGAQHAGRGRGAARRAARAAGADVAARGRGRRGVTELPADLPLRERILAARDQRPGAREPQARDARRARQRGRADQGVVARRRASTPHRLGMSDHSWVHIQIVTNIALRLARLLFRARRRAGDGHRPRDDREGRRGRDRRRRAAPLPRDGDPPPGPRALLAVPRGRQAARAARGHLRRAGAHDRRGRGAARDHQPPVARAQPFTIEGAIVRVADALDMAKGRARLPFEAGETNIHSLSAYAIESVTISAGRGHRRARRDRDVQQRRDLPGRRGPRARSSAARRSSSTSRSSPASRPSTRSASCRSSASELTQAGGCAVRGWRCQRGGVPARRAELDAHRPEPRERGGYVTRSEQIRHAGRALAALAARQHGVVATRAAAGTRVHAVGDRPAGRAGAPASRARRRLRGRSPRASRPRPPLGGRPRPAASGAVGSHQTAAAIWDLRGLRGGVAARHRPAREREPIAPRPARSPHEAHRRSDVTERDGLRVTTVARTLIDLGDVVRAEQVRRAFVRAEQLRLLDMARARRCARACRATARRRDPARAAARVRPALAGDALGPGAADARHRARRRPAAAGGERLDRRALGGRPALERRAARRRGRRRRGARHPERARPGCRP